MKDERNMALKNTFSVKRSNLIKKASEAEDVER